MSDEQNYLMHYGILRKSGRYPWGSGQNAHQRNKQFLDFVDDLMAKGMSEAEVAKAIGLMDQDEKFTTDNLRALRSIAKNEQRAHKIATAQRLKDTGMSTSAIGREMGVNESTVRGLLAPGAKDRADRLVVTANLLKDQIEDGGYLDVGEGVENHLGISKEQLKTAVAILEEEGYKRHHVKVQQLGTGKETTLKVLSKPDVPYAEVYKNRDKIKTIGAYSEDGGRTFLGIEPPVSVDLNRIGVRYAEDGGSKKDGIIELRPGVEDLSLGSARYAQVRVKAGNDHYLKGMAMYSDDLPDGVDIMFNTNKSNTGNKTDAMKALKDDPDNPFGSIIRQKHYVDSKGGSKLSPLNIVGSTNPLNPDESTSGEEGGWYKWSSKLSSQMLSKQSPALAKKQLGLAYKLKEAEFDEINSLTNPAVKKLLMEKFADGADSSAVSLKAAGLPRTKSHVILPINSLKDDEIFAPQYRDGEKVVLIRHPHGGIFEIPELTVNNRNAEGKRLIPGARDAVGINHKVAERLSGADFDGDTVLVIPNKQSGPDRVKNMKPLKELEGYDPKTKYQPYDGMKTIDGGRWDAKKKAVVYGPKGQNKAGMQQKMGDVSNLITDMTIQEAPFSEIARAVRHSMTVIDSEKHHLDYKLSEQENGIKELKVKYQSRPDGRAGGASTLISRAGSDIRVPYRVPRKAKDGGPVDKETGKKQWTYTNESYVDKNGKTVVRTIKSKKLAETEDAFSLSSGTVMESVYADHSNRLKALANEARRVAVNTPNARYSPTAAKAYKAEVTSLNNKLDIALRNKPLERQAQLAANATVTAKRQANPNMSKDDLKKIKSMALAEARVRVGARRTPVEITPPEWNAIQSGAISDSKLKQILQNTDLDVVKTYATPRDAPVMGTAKVSRAKAMLAAGYTPADVAEALGVPTSTLNSALDRKD